MQRTSLIWSSKMQVLSQLSKVASWMRIKLQLKTRSLRPGVSNSKRLERVLREKETMLQVRRSGLTVRVSWMGTEGAEARRPPAST